MRRLRLAAIALVAQGAMNSLNPVIRVRRQFADALRDHGQGLTRSALDARICELLSTVGLGPEVADKYPHELSGGMKQRVVIAIAISLRAHVIIADEPTSALDVVVQRQVVETLRRVQEKIGAVDPARRPRHGVDGPGRRPARGHVRGHACRSLRRPDDLPRAPSSLYPTTDCEPADPRTQGRLSGHTRLAPVAAQSRRRGCSFRTRCPHAMSVAKWTRQSCARFAQIIGSRATFTKRARRNARCKPPSGHEMSTLLEARAVTKIFGGGMRGHAQMTARRRLFARHRRRTAVHHRRWSAKAAAARPRWRACC